MDIKQFYKKVDAFFSHSESSLFDKLKLDSSDLVNAVKSNNDDEVAKVLNAWVNPNKEDGLGRIPLPYAVENNSEMIVGMLLRKKADPNVLGEDGQSPLFKAVFWENENLVHLLLHAGAKVDFQNKDGRTALDEAQANSYLRIVDILNGEQVAERKKQIEKDTATHNQMKEKAQAIKTAKEQKIKEEAAKQEQILKTDIENKYLKNEASYEVALAEAIRSKDSKAVKFLIDKIEDINAIDQKNNPLALAVSLNQTKLADYLLESGADLFYNEKETTEYLIFHDSIRKQQYGIIEKALQKKENSEIILNDPAQDLTAQFLSYKDPKMFDILLQAGADPYFGGREGVCPIKKAIEKGSIAILPVLSKNKVDLSKETEGKSLLAWAVNYKRKDWVNGLISEGALKILTKDQIENLVKEATAVEDQDEEIVNMLNTSLNSAIE